MESRLEQFIREEGLTKSQFADRISMARAAISHILSGRNRPGYDFFCKLTEEFPSLNLDWLLHGRGNMYKEGTEGEVMLRNESVLFPDSGNRTENAVPQQQIFSQSPRKVTRVMLFYDDGSYEEFDKS